MVSVCSRCEIQFQNNNKSGDFHFAACKRRASHAFGLSIESHTMVFNEYLFLALFPWNRPRKLPVCLLSRARLSMHFIRLFLHFTVHFRFFSFGLFGADFDAIAAAVAACMYVYQGNGGEFATFNIYTMTLFELIQK